MTLANHKQTFTESLKQSMGYVGLVSFDAETTLVRNEFDARQEFCHPGGVIQGGFVSGWIDSTMANVIHLDSDYAVSPLSLDLKISFLNATLPGRVFAEAWLVKKGRSIAFLEGQLLNESGEVLARGSSAVKLFKV